MHLGLKPEGSGTVVQPLPPQSGPVPSGNCTPTLGFNAYVNTGTLNFREGPAVQFPIMATLPECATVQLTGFKGADPVWVQVILPDGRESWANSKYMVMGVGTDQMATLSD